MSSVVRSSERRVQAKRSIWTRPMELREAIDGYIFVSPFVLGLIIFTLGPFIAGFYFSLTNYDVITAPKWVGFLHYKTMLFNDEDFWICVWNTAYYVGLSVVPHIILSLLLALLLNAKVRGITLFRTLFYLPAIVPSVASIAIFMTILHDRFGILNEFLYNIFGIIGPRWLTSPVWTKPSIIVWSLWGLGGSMIIYLAALQGVPEALYEAASIDGAGVMRRFWNITIPMISPTLFFVLVMGIIGSFQVFTPVFLIAGGGAYGDAPRGPLNSLLFWVVYIYNSAFFYFRMGYASALAWVLFLVLVVMTVIQFSVSRRWVYYEGEERQ